VRSDPASELWTPYPVANYMPIYVQVCGTVSMVSADVRRWAPSQPGFAYVFLISMLAGCVLGGICIWALVTHNTQSNMCTTSIRSL
jgi:hypothetical protein